MDAVRTAPGSRRSRTYTYALHGVGLRLEGDDPSLLLRVRAILEHFDARLLHENGDQCTVELVGGGRDIDAFLKRAAGIAEIATVVRSGAMAIGRGAPALGRA